MIHPGSYWMHKHDGYEVKVGDEENRLSKAPSDAAWHPAVSYARTDLEESPIFTRTVVDFLAKFEAVKRDEGDV